jgi:hypothetical protein
MKTGEKIYFLYVPFIGFIVGTENMEENMKRILQAEAKKELEDKKYLRKLKREYPNATIENLGDGWLISENKKE